MRVTLTLDERQAEALAHTLSIGAIHRYAPTLQRESQAIADYVAERVGRAKLARRRAQRAEQLAGQVEQ